MWGADDHQGPVHNKLQGRWQPQQRDRCGSLWVPGEPTLGSEASNIELGASRGVFVRQQVTSEVSATGSEAKQGRGLSQGPKLPECSLGTWQPHLPEASIFSFICKVGVLIAPDSPRSLEGKRRSFQIR